MMFMKFWLSVFTWTLLLTNVKGIDILFDKKKTCTGCITLVCQDVEGNASWLLNDTLINENEKYSIRKEENIDRTFLTIHNLTIADEGNYICKDEESKTSETLYVMPDKIETDNESLIVYPERSFTIDCGIEIGIESQKCLSANLRHDESDEDLNLTSPNYSFNGNKRNPSFTVHTPNTTHNSYFCSIKVGSPCTIHLMDSKHYFISYAASVNLVPSELQTVPQGSPVNLSCNVNHPNSSMEITREWIIVPEVETLSNSDKQNETLEFTPPSDLTVICEATVKLNGQSIPTNKSLDIIIAPEVEGLDFEMQRCDTLLISSKTDTFTHDLVVVTQKENVTISKNRSNDTIPLQSTTSVDIHNVVNNVLGPSISLSIPKCSTEQLTFEISISIDDGNCFEANTEQIVQVTRRFLELHVANCSFPQICTEYTPEILNTTCITSNIANITFNISAFNSELFKTFCNETEGCHNIKNINNNNTPSPVSPTTESQSPMQYITIIGGSCLGILILLVVVLLLCLCKQMIAKRKHRNYDQGERGIPLDKREGQTGDSAVTQEDETQFHGNDNEGISLSARQPNPEPSVNFSNHTCTSSISAHSSRQNEDLSTCRSHHHLHDERCSRTSTINSGRDYSHPPSICSNCSQSQLLQQLLLQQFHAFGRNVHGYNPSFSVDSQPQIDSCEECWKTYRNYISQVVSSVSHQPSICHTHFPHSTYDDTREQFQTHSGHLTETKSHVSNDTGVCSTFSNPSERPQSHRPQKSTKSSGYFSHATSSVCDPLILNPHGKPGCNIPDGRTDIYQQRDDQKRACDLIKNGIGTRMSRDSAVTTSRLCSSV